ncbi:serine kinase [Dyadobacter sandarakinus]|uniref:Serine kinase n=1 Tax=Dyadobacter sandarakinus TaxID=2747268 RepID=A0ABX7I7B9_9BACT|nr:serine kinase [Dyadobacter sandarakinus]QRR01733.1 serine kinase [Dyadobacter sandarakinus]
MYSYRAFGLHIFSEIELPELVPVSSEDPYDLHIVQAAFPVPAVRPTHIYRRGICADFAQSENSLFLHWKGLASYKAADGNMLYVQPFTSDPSLLSLFTVSEALGLILFQRGMFLLHASAVQIGKESWCFMGTPGAGKSTTAAAFVKAGCALLSDDLTAISFKHGVPYIVPAYPQLKIWEKTVEGLGYNTAHLSPVSEGVNKFAYHPQAGFPEEPVRLGRIYFLHKIRNRKKEEVLSAPAIPAEMLRNFPLPAELLAAPALKKHFIESLQCASHAQIMKKRRPAGFAELELWVAENLTNEPTLAHHA